MKNFLVSAAIAIGLASGVSAQDATEGIWQTQVDDGAYAFVTIGKCGDALCGVISQTFNADGEYASENIGKQLVWAMQVQANGKYNRG